MIHLRVIDFFQGWMKEEGWMKFMFLFFVSFGNVHMSCFFYPKHINNRDKMENVKRFSFASSAVSNLTLQKNRAMVQLTAPVT